MKRIKILSEYRAVIFTVLIIIAVVITGTILYIDLYGISKKVSESKLTNSQASIITKQILVELRSDENNVNSFHLTRDSSYIAAFNKTVPILEKQISALKKNSIEYENEGQIIDSIINLTRKRFSLFKVQFYTEDPIMVTNELNIISQQIDETYRRQEGLNISNANADTLKKMGDFFRRLFGRKEVTRDTIENKRIINSKDQLKNTILKVKSSQMH